MHQSDAAAVEQPADPRDPKISPLKSRSWARAVLQPVPQGREPLAEELAEPPVLAAAPAPDHHPLASPVVQ